MKWVKWDGDRELPEWNLRYLGARIYLRERPGHPRTPSTFPGQQLGVKH